MTNELPLAKLYGLTCPLCNKLIKEATSISVCHHNFCRKCIRDKILNDKCCSCPVCGIHLGGNPLEKLRSEPDLEYIRDKVFPKPGASVPVAAGTKRKERSLFSLVVNSPAIALPGAKKRKMETYLSSNEGKEYSDSEEEEESNEEPFSHKTLNKLLETSLDVTDLNETDPCRLVHLTNEAFTWHRAVSDWFQKEHERAFMDNVKLRFEVSTLKVELAKAQKVRDIALQGVDSARASVKKETQTEVKRVSKANKVLEEEVSKLKNLEATEIPRLQAEINHLCDERTAQNDRLEQFSTKISLLKLKLAEQERNYVRRIDAEAMLALREQQLLKVGAERCLRQFLAFLTVRGKEVDRSGFAFDSTNDMGVKIDSPATIDEAVIAAALLGLHADKDGDGITKGHREKEGTNSIIS